MTCSALRLWLALSCSVALSASLPDEYETVRTSNAAILNRLGLVALGPTADGHHRKRLAESLQPHGYGRRHGGSAHDSHVYVVKLPPSPAYYSHSRPHGLDKNLTLAKPGFKGNGKPAKIFHWNLPLVKKINDKKKHAALARMELARRRLEADNHRLKVADKMSYFKKLAQLVPAKPTRNNDKWLSDLEKVEPRIESTGNATQLKILSLSNEKSYRLANDLKAEKETSRGHHHQHQNFNNWHDTSTNNDVQLPQQSSRNALTAEFNGAQQQHPKKHRKKSAGVSYYYAPALTGKSASTSISKHFPGNGKPKAFYVMEKSRKPVYYHPLLP